jgi:hypothetical protein
VNLYVWSNVFPLHDQNGKFLLRLNHFLVRKRLFMKLGPADFRTLQRR